MTLICYLPLLLLAFCCVPAGAAFVSFENCLDPNIVNSRPVQLQFVPLFVHASYDTANRSHNLNVTVYGNVSGSATITAPPPPSDPQWANRNATLGKIVDLSELNNKYSTLFAKFNVLSYTPYDMPPARFCGSLVRGECPLGPAFDADPADPDELPAFSVAHQLYSSYSFTTLSATLRVTSGDANNAVLACVSANITPSLGGHLAGLLRFIPLAILMLVGAATAFAAVLSPWGSTDTFRWTSNYGRDADLLRLVTPGFGDCLQYLQFAVLTGALSLSYPGYFQPVVARASWSTLMFNASFVSRGNGTQSMVDGVYVPRGAYGLDRLSQLVGQTSVKDVWAGAVVWLLVIIAVVVILIQAGFALRWGYRHLSDTREEDLRAKNLPFTIGNVVRVVFNYFLLPIVALSMFQLVVTTVAPLAPHTTAFAVVVLLLLIGFAVWLLRLIATTRPRSYLFDDLPTVLLYGPLYNTYSDNAAPFALIPVFLQFVRGVAIGAVQHSGIAQLVLLAICEVILILTLHAFRPFHSRTSNNAYHTFFAIVRLLTTLLSVAFVPSLGVTEAPKGWIGYVILLMHGIVLVFGFFLNAVQTIVEVGARLAGAGGEEGVGGGAARGGLVKVFGMRQLSRRMSRPGVRNSEISDAELLAAESDRKAQLSGGRARSTSGSSAVLLNRHCASDGRGSGSGNLESMSASGRARRESEGGYTPTTPGAQSTFSYMPAGPPGNVSAQSGGSGPGPEAADPYYRPPRRRAPTMDSPGAPSRGSWASGDWINKRWSHASASRSANMDPLYGPSISGRGTPVPAYLTSHELSDSNVNEHRRDPTDYAVREVDFYYGVRGPALSNLPTRRLGTGPADPTGPAASAAGWFKGLFGGKTKDKGKGFEVVRSARAPPQGLPRSPAEGDLPPSEGQGMAAAGPRTPRHDAGPRPEEIGRAIGPEEASFEGDEEQSSEDDEGVPRRFSDVPPSLPSIDTGGSIELPSRVGSAASGRNRMPPKVPRKSSKRRSALAGAPAGPNSRLSAIRASPPQSPRLYDPPPTHPQHQAQVSSGSSFIVPFERTPSEAEVSRTSTGVNSVVSSMLAHTPDEGGQGGHARHSSSALGGMAVDTSGQRTSLGYVQQHRASDNVHKVVQGQHEGVDYLGSSAEVVEAGRRASLQSQGSHGRA